LSNCDKLVLDNNPWYASRDPLYKRQFFMFIGKRVKEIRKQQGMKLIDLAKNSTVQIATLSRIENDKMTGTLESHMAIAKALGVDVTTLYTDINREDSAVEVKTKQTTTDMFVHSDKSSYEILTSKLLSKKMMPILLKIEPDGQSNKEENVLGAEKFVFVLEGRVEVHIGNETYSLSKNNSLYFNSNVGHYFVNTGKTTAKIISVATPVAL